MQSPPRRPRCPSRESRSRSTCTSRKGWRSSLASPASYSDSGRHVPLSSRSSCTSWYLGRFDIVRDQDGIRNRLLQRVEDSGEAVDRETVRFVDLGQKSLDEFLLLNQSHVLEGIGRLLHELPHTLPPRVRGVNDCEDILLQLIVEIPTLQEVLLRRSGAPDDQTRDLGVIDEDPRSVLAHPVEVVGEFHLSRPLIATSTVVQHETVANETTSYGKLDIDELVVAQIPLPPNPLHFCENQLALIYHSKLRYCILEEYEPL